MRIVCLAALLVTTAAVAPALGGPQRTTSLVITRWASEGTNGPSVRRVLRCDPVGGTLHRAAAACHELAAAGYWKAFAPPPADETCSQIYGGPAHALVTGHVGGRRVWVRLQRRNGCEIARWNRLGYLLN